MLTNSMAHALGTGTGKCRKWHVEPTTAAPTTQPPAVLGAAGDLTCRGRKPANTKGLSNFVGDIAQCMATARSLNAITRSCNRNNRKLKDGAFTCTANTESDGNNGEEESFLSFKGTVGECKLIAKAFTKGIKQFNVGAEPDCVPSKRPGGAPKCTKPRTAKFVCKATEVDDVFHVYHKASGRCATEAK